MSSDTTSVGPAPAVVAAAQAEATRLYQLARAAVFAPEWHIATAWQTFQARTRAAAPPPGSWPNTAADHASRHQQHAIALDAQKVFRAVLDMTQDERERAWVADRDAAMINASQRTQAIAAAAASRLPQWSAAEFTSAIARHGVTLSTNAAGAILARPAGLLSDADKEVIRQHRAAIVAALSDAEEVT